MDDSKQQFAELLAHDTLESIRTRLEAFADSYERVADGRKQTELAQEFSGFVHDFVRHPLILGDLNGLFGLGHWLAVYAADFRWIGGNTEFGALVRGLEEFSKDCIAAYESWRRSGVWQEDKDEPAKPLDRVMSQHAEQAEGNPEATDGVSDAKKGMTEDQRVQGFRALVASDMSGGYQMEDADGRYRYWNELSHEGKLRQIANNAAYYDVPFDPFVEAVRGALGPGNTTGREEAALRLVLRSERELHALEKLFPDDGRTEPPPPLVERFQEMMGQPVASTTDHPTRQREKFRQVLESTVTKEEHTQERSKDRGREM